MKNDFVFGAFLANLDIIVCRFVVGFDVHTSFLLSVRHILFNILILNLSHGHAMHVATHKKLINLLNSSSVFTNGRDVTFDITSNQIYFAISYSHVGPAVGVI